MNGTIQVIMSGDLPDVDLDLTPYVYYCKNIEKMAEKKIAALPEFSQKRKGISVALLLPKANGEPIPIEGKTIETVIEIDAREILKGKTEPREIERILVDAAVSAILKELPGIEASPETILESETEKKKKWWQVWKK